LPLLLPFCLSFPAGICFFPCRCSCLSVCHLPFCLSFPAGICFFPCRCPCLSVCHSRRESASSLAVALAFLVVIPRGICFFLCRCPRLFGCHSRRNLLLPLPFPHRLPQRISLKGESRRLASEFITHQPPSLLTCCVANLPKRKPPASPTSSSQRQRACSWKRN